MARKRRNDYRPSKKNIYFIVEGHTEENYIKLLKIIYRKDIRVEHCNGGSAKNVLEKAKKIIRQNGNEYKGYVVWFDKDTFNISRDSNLLNSLKAKNNVEVYISSPCMENWLLAHFQKINKDEPTCKKCEKILEEKYIPRYHKDDCSILSKFINEDEIKTATLNYPELKEIPTIVENNRL